MGIEGVAPPKSIVEKTKASSSVAAAEETASSATEGVKEAIKSKVAEAVDAAKTVLADTDGDGQEHNEL